MSRTALISVIAIGVVLVVALGLLVGWEAAFVALLLVLVGGLLGWRAPMRRARSADEALEQQALRSEQDRNRDTAVEGAERIYRNHP